MAVFAPSSRPWSTIEEDELVEITPAAIRLRKVLLDENERKRADRKMKKAVVAEA